ncbi:acyl-CoA Delta(11) desaturase [Orussus abietinus]|uniref:acyl-CoA Delta(11) desaturase n=1 Tax=Orussus abietinus TaxID=222816 RepID=UPI000626E847|nr:acyl-CoA Delta(11) desaturase [Orussus abietinus]
MYSSTVTEFEDSSKKNSSVDFMGDSASVPKEPAKQSLVWQMIFGIGLLHYLSIYALVTKYHEATFWTWVWSTGYGVTAGLGVTAGAHRLWAHRSYSAKLPVRIFLAVLFCIAAQDRFYKWIRDHRTHHRYTETPADPHDASRGFFFSHIGWLMVKRHPAVKRYGSKVDMSDVLADPVIRYTDKVYYPLSFFLSFLLPTLIPVYYWNETWYISFHAMLIRYTISLHLTFLVNSAAHLWGNRPYDSRMNPVESPSVAFVALGEGWHNYHHSFPWDYKAAELGNYGLNPSTAFIDFMAWLGLAYDLKTPSKDVIHKMCLKKGDGSCSLWGRHHIGTDCTDDNCETGIHRTFNSVQEIKSK